MDLGTIHQINIDTEMQASYLDYAMSVIVARALPDVRDGLKPVHRRILYAMHDLGLTSDKSYKKSARIVGEVLGKYHPHGDAAVYEAMVRMAQDFSLRYPLVDGQGNFGSIDGDNAAAMRYTEARLAAISNEMLADIEKDTVDWTDNFDGSLREPVVLPAALPNLLINGASGIAVGMATNIPPHNLGEVCDALCYLIDNYDCAEDVTVDDLMKFIQGPDFPTGGVVYRYQNEGNGADAQQVDVIAKAYAGGRGAIVMQAKAHIEEMSRSRNRIVITELPYQTDKTRLIERIAELARDGRLEGLTDLRDESDRTGMRINIELTRNVDPRDVLADLFKLTPLQATFGVSLLALVDGEPRLLSLKRILLHYLEHRQDVIVRRSRYELERARERAHILEGLLRALDVLDEIIALIRRSRSADTAKQNLIEQFKFTAIQAQAILDMQLRRLAALERRKLQDEYREMTARIKELEALLASPKKVLALVKQNLLDLRERYADARRTQIADRVKGTLTAHDILPDQDVWITLGADGTLMRQRPDPAQMRTTITRGGWSVQHLLPANTRDDVYLFSARGQATRVPAHRIPEAPGNHFADLSGFTRRDRVVAMLAFAKPDGEEDVSGYLALGTAQGKVKRVALADLFDQAPANPQVVGLDNGDELLWADTGPGGGEFFLVTSGGRAIRFAEDDVRAMGLAAGGIAGIKLGKPDRVVGGWVIPGGGMDPGDVVVMTGSGFAKQMALADFPVQGRSGQGVVAAKTAERSGDLAGAAALPAAAAATVVCLLSGGGARLIAAQDVPQMGRPAQGKPVLALPDNEHIQQLYVVRSPSREYEPPAPDTSASRGDTGAVSAPRTGRGRTENGRSGVAAAGRKSKAATTVTRPRAAQGRAKAAASAAEDGQVTAGASRTRRKAVAAQAPDAGPAQVAAAPAANSKRSKAASPTEPPVASTPAGTGKRSRTGKTVASEASPSAAVASPARTARGRSARAASTSEAASPAPAPGTELAAAATGRTSASSPASPPRRRSAASGGQKSLVSGASTADAASGQTAPRTRAKSPAPPPDMPVETAKPARRKKAQAAGQPSLLPMDAEPTTEPARKPRGRKANPRPAAGPSD